MSVENYQVGVDAPLFLNEITLMNGKKSGMKLNEYLKKILMEKTQETIDVLNDLILINNDRIAGYEKAIEELKADDKVDAEDLDLTVLFEKMIDDSREMRNALGKEVQVLGGK